MGEGRSWVASLPFGLYVGIVAIRWWPLPLHLGDQLSYIPQFECDGLHSTWALAWSSHALRTDSVRLVDANIYFPAWGALFYGPTGFGALAFFGPAYLLSGSTIVAINITLRVAARGESLGSRERSGCRSGRVSQPTAARHWRLAGGSRR